MRGRITIFQYIQFSFISKIEYYEPAMKSNGTEPPADRCRQALFVGSDVYRQPAFGKHHPLSIIRVAGVVDLCRMLGWFEPGQYRDSPQATLEQLLAFHDADYVEALRAADASGKVEPEIRQRYRIGTMENPLFPGLFRRAATAVGGSIHAAELALERRVVFHPSAAPIMAAPTAPAASAISTTRSSRS